MTLVQMENQTQEMLTGSRRGSHNRETHSQADHHRTLQSPDLSSKYKRDTSGHQRVPKKSSNVDKMATAEGYIKSTSNTSLQGPSSDEALNTRAERQRYDLLGIDSQTVDRNKIRNEDHLTHDGEEQKCPYHSPHFQDRLTDPRYIQASPMDRYLAESPSERSAVLQQRYRQDRSTRMGCRCPDITGGMGNGNSRT